MVDKKTTTFLSEEISHFRIKSFFKNYLYHIDRQTMMKGKLSLTLSANNNLVSVLIDMLQFLSPLAKNSYVEIRQRYREY